jgi:hypothetical protein
MGRGVPGAHPWALKGWTPDSLRAMSYSVELPVDRILLRAHFGSVPSDAELEMLSAAEAEILAAMPDKVRTCLTWEVVPVGAEPVPLPGGFAWRRDEICQRPR